MNDPLPIFPFTSGGLLEAVVPGSKSQSNRALLLAALCPRPVRLENLLDSEDTRLLRKALADLGVEVRAGDAPDAWIIAPRGPLLPADRAELAVGNAGTAARFLPALLALRPGGSYRLDGSPAMRRRPMAGLLEALAATGAITVHPRGEPGHFPFDLDTHGWEGGRVEVDASASSQILSGLLLAATGTAEGATIQLRGTTVSAPFIEMTLAMIRAFGGRAEKVGEGCFRVEPGLEGPPADAYRIEPDATAASYFFALPVATGGPCAVGGWPAASLQGDLRFLEVLAESGLPVAEEGDRIRTGPRPPGGLPPTDRDFNAFSDTFLTWAALSPLLGAPFRITGIGHTRHQETDRVAAVAAELRRLGQAPGEERDALALQPDRAALRSVARDEPVTIRTYEDHRMAMSFAVLGCHDLHGDGRPWLAIADPGCCAKTFPDFFGELERLRTAANARPAPSS